MNINRKHLEELVFKRANLCETKEELNEFVCGGLCIAGILGGLYTAYDLATDDEIGIGGSVWSGGSDDSTTGAAAAGAAAGAAGSIYDDPDNVVVNKQDLANTMHNLHKLGHDQGHGAGMTAGKKQTWGTVGKMGLGAAGVGGLAMLAKSLKKDKKKKKDDKDIENESTDLQRINKELDEGWGGALAGGALGGGIDMAGAASMYNQSMAGVPEDQRVGLMNVLMADYSDNPEMQGLQKGLRTAAMGGIGKTLAGGLLGHYIEKGADDREEQDESVERYHYNRVVKNK
mgnify:CR=1 FL=1